MSNVELPSDERTMDAETLTALRGSIAKWEAIVAGTGLELGADNCPLCQRFNIHVNPEARPRCVGCPVREATDMPNCEGTPYDDYSEAEETLSEDDEEAERLQEAMDAAAKAEVAFLKSLLPENGNV